MYRSMIFAQLNIRFRTPYHLKDLYFERLPDAMDLYSKALINAARDARRQGQELCRLGRRLRDESNQYRQASYCLGDLSKARQNLRPGFPNPKLTSSAALRREVS
jgi:hypothetical protein